MLLASRRPLLTQALGSSTDNLVPCGTYIPSQKSKMQWLRARWASRKGPGQLTDQLPAARKQHLVGGSGRTWGLLSSHERSGRRWTRKEDHEKAGDNAEEACCLRGSGSLSAGGDRTGGDRGCGVRGSGGRGGRDRGSGGRRPGDPSSRRQEGQDPAPQHRGARGGQAAREGAGRGAGAEGKRYLTRGHSILRAGSRVLLARSIAVAE